MATIRLKYLISYLDRHKRQRWYVRRKGERLVPIPDPETPEGYAAYHAAVGSPKATTKPTARAAAGSGRALLAEFYASDYWQNTIKPITQAEIRRYFEHWATDWGANKVHAFTRKNVQQMLDDRSAAPAAARAFLKWMRILFDFAVDREYRADNPFRTVKLKPMATEGHIAWSDADIAQFASAHLRGSKARRAMMLLLYTTQRRSDVHRMGAQHVKDGCIVITQVKGRKGKPPVELTIPIHPALQAELDLAPPGPVFIPNAYGRQFTADSFGTWFAKQAQAAGLEERTAHGLRKAGARHHAEAGSGAPQIAAMTGHRTLNEVERYTRSAAQKRLAKHAMDTLVGTKVSNPPAESV